MTRGFEIPKASPDAVGQGIFDGLQNKEEDIFPDPASQSIAEGWRTGVAKGVRAPVRQLRTSTASQRIVRSETNFKRRK